MTAVCSLTEQIEQIEQTDHRDPTYDRVHDQADYYIQELLPRILRFDSVLLRRYHGESAVGVGIEYLYHAVERLNKSYPDHPNKLAYVWVSVKYHMSQVARKSYFERKNLVSDIVLYDNIQHSVQIPIRKIEARNLVTKNKQEERYLELRLAGYDKFEIAKELNLSIRKTVKLMATVRDRNKNRYQREKG